LCHAHNRRGVCGGTCAHSELGLRILSCTGGHQAPLVHFQCHLPPLLGICSGMPESIGLWSCQTKLRCPSVPWVCHCGIGFHRGQPRSLPGGYLTLVLFSSTQCHSTRGFWIRSLVSCCGSKSATARLQKAPMCRALVAHAYNPSSSGGRDQMDHGSKPARANSS
jgi:hypothetical protein